MKRILTYLILLAVVILIAWLVFRRSEPPLQPFTKVHRETLVSTLRTNGKVEPLVAEDVRARVPGLITAVPVRAGRAVKKGQLLVEYGEPGALEGLQAAEARAAQARAQSSLLEQGGRSAELVEIENQINKTRAERDLAKKDFEALSRLQAKQAATGVEVDAAQARLHAAELNLQALDKRRTALVSPGELTAAKERIRETDAAVQLAKSRLSEGTLRAPIDGVVYNLPAKPGVYLNLGDLAASVGRLDRLRIKVFVDEPELGRVTVGQPVKITWDAEPTKNWSGTVERKPTQIVPLGTRQVGEVLVAIDNPGLELVPGTNVNAEIRASVVENALTVPKEVLRRENNVIGVFVLKGDHVAWQPVKTGASSVTRAVITDGLSEGDSVALPAEVALKNGAKVKAVWP